MATMQMDKLDIAGKPKRVGVVGQMPVFKMVTKGGLTVIVKAKGSSFEPIATGSHDALATYIAEKKEPKLVWDALSKDEHPDISWFGEALVKKYEDLTDEMRRLHGD